MVFKMRPWVCSSQKRQCDAPDCVLRGLQQTVLHRVAGSHLYPLLLQVNAVCQVLTGDDIWVLVLMEKRLQGLQLILGEYGAMPACPALDLVEGLQLAQAPLGTLADPDRRVEELHGPGEPGVCRGRGTAAALGVMSQSTHLAQGSSHTSCICTCGLEGGRRPAGVGDELRDHHASERRA